MNSVQPLGYWAWDIDLPFCPSIKVMGLCYGLLVSINEVQAVKPLHVGDESFENLGQLDNWPLANMLLELVESRFDKVCIVQEEWPSPSDGTIKSEYVWKSLYIKGSEVRNIVNGDLVSDVRLFTLLTDVPIDKQSLREQRIDNVGDALSLIAQCSDADFILFCGADGSDRILTTPRVVTGLRRCRHATSMLNLTWQDFATGELIAYQ